MFTAPLATETLRRSPPPALPTAHPASPVQRALDGSPRVTAQLAVASRLARRGAGGVVQREGNGLAEPEAMAAYALPLRDTVRVRDLDTRVIEIKRAINEALERAGVPPIEIGIVELGGSASFDEQTWTMNLLGSSLESADPSIVGELVGTAYHEARHAEQFFRVAQQAAAANDDVGLFRLKLPDGIRQAAVASKAKFARLGEATQKATTEWSESLKNPVSVLDAMEAAGRELATKVELYSSSLQVLLLSVRMLADQLLGGVLGAGDVRETANILTNHREEETGLTQAARLYQVRLIAYRRMPHEADAHTLGWQVEDTFRTGRFQATHDPAFASRVPDDDPIWTEIAALDRSLDQLQDLLDALQQASKSSASDSASSSSSSSAARSAADEDEDDLDALLEPTVEERAKAVAERLVGGDATKSFDVEYRKALEVLRKGDAAKVQPSDLNPRTGGERLALLADALRRWSAIEPRYLSALSARLHRRTNF